MSWSLSHKGPARDAVARHQEQIGLAKPGRGVLEHVAIDATLSLVEAAVKHTEHSDAHATVTASGHHGEDGTGHVAVRVQIIPAPKAKE